MSLLPNAAIFQPEWAWASEHLETRGVGAHALLANWCRLVQREELGVTCEDWTAYRILSGDGEAWHEFSQDHSALAERIQWNSLNQFERAFLGLSKGDKRQAYDAMRKHLSSNAAALRRLDRYDRFLHLDPMAHADPSDTEQLVVWLVRISTCGSIKQQEILSQLMELVEKEPIRWRAAAREVRTHPQYSMIEPQITRRIANMLYAHEQDKARQRELYRHFRSRYGTRLLAQRTKSTIFSVPLVLMAVPVALALFAFFAQPKTEPDPSITTRKQLERAAQILMERQQERSKIYPPERYTDDAVGKSP